MHPSTITCPAQPKPVFSKRVSRKERLAIQQLTTAYQSLLEDARIIHHSIHVTQNNYNYLQNQQEIDACIYQLRTQQCRYMATLYHLQELTLRMNNLINEG